MQNLQAMRFDLQEILVASQFLIGVMVRRERQALSSIGLDFFLQCRHVAQKLGRGRDERKFGRFQNAPDWSLSQRPYGESLTESFVGKPIFNGTSTKCFDKD